MSELLGLEKSWSQSGFRMTDSDNEDCQIVGMAGAAAAAPIHAPALCLVPFFALSLAYFFVSLHPQICFCQAFNLDTFLGNDAGAGHSNQEPVGVARPKAAARSVRPSPPPASEGEVM